MGLGLGSSALCLQEADPGQTAVLCRQFVPVPVGGHQNLHGLDSWLEQLDELSNLSCPLVLAFKMDAMLAW